MNCQYCQQVISEQARFCVHCGKPTAPAAQSASHAQPVPQAPVQQAQVQQPAVQPMGQQPVVQQPQSQPVQSQQQIPQYQQPQAQAQQQIPQYQQPQTQAQQPYQAQPHYPQGQYGQPQQTYPGAQAPSRNVLADVANTIQKVAGIDSPVDIKLKEVFSNTFKKHTEEEAERMFSVGTPQSTPSMENVLDTWPKPWLFFRVFLIVAITYLGLYIGVEHFQNENFLPGMMTMGSFMIPITLLVFFWEMNAWQNISIYQVLKMLFVGGVLSLVITVFLFDFIGGDNPNALMIGIIEEAAKVLALLYFLRQPKYPYVLNGLLIGAAIGAGFAAFETNGYIFRFLMAGGTDTAYDVMFWRAVLAPGGHIVWAALSGAAICMVKGYRPFSFNMLQDMRFLRIFGIVVLLHAAWDYDFGIRTGDIPVQQIVLTLIAWIIAFAVMGTGLREISNLKKGAGQTAQPAPAPAPQQQTLGM